MVFYIQFSSVIPNGSSLSIKLGSNFFLHIGHTRSTPCHMFAFGRRLNVGAWSWLKCMQYSQQLARQQNQHLPTGECVCVFARARAYMNTVYVNQPKCLSTNHQFGTWNELHFSRHALLTYRTCIVLFDAQVIIIRCCIHISALHQTLDTSVSAD
jgi:hypothetical protein